MSWGRFNYLAQRILRNLLPAPVAVGARRLFGGIAGGESHAPEHFAGHYEETLARAERSFQGSRVLIFGHGPSYGFACALLATGAEHVYLWDPYAGPDDRANRRWLEEYPQYLQERGGRVEPHAGWMTLIDAGARPAEVEFPNVDLAVSTSVFEHLADPDLWAAKLARAVDPGGVNLHMIDLRDHFFERPFEMLCYSEATWRRWLNPRHHLNRWRHDDYERMFRRHFGRVSIEILESDPELFEAYRPRIRPEFVTGDRRIDSVLEIEVLASAPLRQRLPEA